MKSALLSFLGLFGFLAVAAPSSAAEVDFAHEVVPILRKHCGKCHTGGKREGAFSLNTRADLLAGGESGPGAVAGKSAQSELLSRILSEDKDVRMPPDGPRVSEKEIAILKQWIDGGVAWDDGFAFQKPAYEPQLKPRQVELPPAVAGRNNPVDRIMDAYFAREKIERPEVASDAVFVRRVYLDLVGLLPTEEQTQQFLADSRPQKRAMLVQELLADDVAYAEHWLSFWNDLLRNDYTGTGFITGGRKQITTWLYQALLTNKPYDQFVRELIAPTADSEGFIQGIKWRGVVNSSQTLEVQFAQNISQAFMGINMKCASCHDSFVDHWKLDQAYGLAAIYATEPLEIHRCDKPTGKMAKASWIFPELGEINAAAPQPERLQQLAGLMTHPENGRLTRTIVNRLWHRLLGRGIVHPTDAMHTEPWNADLLDFLASDFAAHGYDLKQTLAIICTSDVYQAKTPSQDSLPKVGLYQFQGPLARRMTAEQFVDSVWQLTGTAPNKSDAGVTRRSPKAAASQAAVTAPTAQWIWSVANAAGAVPEANLSLAFRKNFELAELPTQAVAAITCDNGYKLFVNGAEVAADGNWETVEAVDVQKQLRQGTNELLIIATNGGDSPNPAALYCEVHLHQAGGKVQSIGTDATWSWSKTLPDATGKYTSEPADWKPASVVENSGLWSSRVGEGIKLALASGSDGSLRMMRSSLVKSDYLMRSLGRPNRDQIVSMRPTDLTTLEAIDLANGQIFAETLERGGKVLHARFGNTPDALITWLYRSALSRQPTAEERDAANQLLGTKPTSAAIEDWVWAVLMLPEFQIVR